MTKQLLITGATGFLGRHLARLAIEQGYEVQALVRRHNGYLQTLGVRQILGDVMSMTSCVEASKGCDGIIHAAGMVSRDGDDTAKMYALHVEGTQNVLEAACKNDVAKICVVSSSGTFAVATDPIIKDESHSYPMELVANWPYYLSKVYQEKAALEAARDRHVVIVNPSWLLGPGDVHGSSTKEIEAIISGKMALVSDEGGIAFVDVRDAAQGCLQALEKGRSGERYILSASNMSMPQFTRKIAAWGEVPMPRAVGSWATGLLSTSMKLMSKTGLLPELGDQALQMSRHYWYTDAKKAMSELGWTIRDTHETLCETVQDVKARVG